MSNSLRSHGLQHTRLPCASPSSRVCSNSCPLSQRCHPTISSSVVPFSSCLQSFPASGSYPVSQLFTSGGQQTYWSLNFSISSSNEYSGLVSFRIDWFDLPAVQGTLKSLLQHHSSKASILWYSAFFTVQHSHPYMTTGKTIAWAIWSFVDKVMSLLFNTPSRFVIAFIPRSKHLLISWLQSPSTVILESKYMKSHTIPTFSPTICHEVIGPDTMTTVFWMLSFKPAFSLSSFTLIKRQAVKHSQKLKKNLLPKITAKAREMKRKKKEFSCNEWSVIFSYWSYLVEFYSWLLPSSLCNFRHIPSLWKKKYFSSLLFCL